MYVSEIPDRDLREWLVNGEGAFRADGRGAPGDGLLLKVDIDERVSTLLGAWVGAVSPRCPHDALAQGARRLGLIDRVGHTLEGPVIYDPDCQLIAHVLDPGRMPGREEPVEHSTQFVKSVMSWRAIVALDDRGALIPLADLAAHGPYWADVTRGFPDVRRQVLSGAHEPDYRKFLPMAAEVHTEEAVRYISEASRGGAGTRAVIESLADRWASDERLLVGASHTRHRARAEADLRRELEGAADDPARALWASLDEARGALADPGRSRVSVTVQRGAVRSDVKLRVDDLREVLCHGSFSPIGTADSSAASALEWGLGDTFTRAGDAMCALDLSSLVPADIASVSYRRKPVYSRAPGLSPALEATVLTVREEGSSPRPVTGLSDARADPVERAMQVARQAGVTFELGRAVELSIDGGGTFSGRPTTASAPMAAQVAPVPSPHAGPTVPGSSRELIARAMAAGAARPEAVGAARPGPREGL